MNIHSSSFSHGDYHIGDGVETLLVINELRFPFLGAFNLTITHCELNYNCNYRNQFGKTAL